MKNLRKLQTIFENKYVRVTCVVAGGVGVGILMWYSLTKVTNPEIDGENFDFETQSRGEDFFDFLKSFGQEVREVWNQAKETQTESSPTGSVFLEMEGGSQASVEVHTSYRNPVDPATESQAPPDIARLAREVMEIKNRQKVELIKRLGLEDLVGLQEVAKK